MNITTPKVYVSTYAKYNNGNLAGAWVELEGHDKETFDETIRGLHKDEADPEFMYQDFEGFPKDFYDESSLDNRLWEWLELDADDREIIEAYAALVYGDFDFEYARDAYIGHFESDRDLGEYLVEATGVLHDVPENIARYFDYDAYGRDASFDLMSHNGHYFYNY